MLATPRDRPERLIRCQSGRHVVAEQIGRVIISKQGGRIVAYRELVAVLQCERCEDEQQREKHDTISSETE